MNNKQGYKYLSQTDFRCFAEHYNEMIAAIYEHINNEETPDAIIINNIAMDMANNKVDVRYYYVYDEDAREIQIPFEYFDNL